MKNKSQERAKSIKGYTHFDKRTNLQQNLQYASNPEFVAKYAFLPLIHFQAVTKKYDKTKVQKYKHKVRELYYCAHLDRSIYMYYADMLNEKYNEKIEKANLNYAVIAYRTNLHGQSSFDFACTAFAAMREIGNCHVIVGDFTSFFDRLEHTHLKKMLCSVLGANKLPDDWFSIYKYLTQFHYIELGTLIHGECLKNPINRYAQKERWIFRRKKLKTTKFTFLTCPLINNDISPDDERDMAKAEKYACGYFEEHSAGNKTWHCGCINRKCYRTFTHNNSCICLDSYRKMIKHHIVDRDNQDQRIGIPQGTPISAVFANVYMLEFDKRINELAQKAGGLYMRYSDDFIIILPANNEFASAFQQINKLIEVTPKLDLKPEKTKIFFHDTAKETTKCITSQYLPAIPNGKNVIEYLGLAYDGKNIGIKAASKFKYLNRANKKVKSILKQRALLGDDKIGARNFYLRYTSVGKLPYKDRRTNKLVAGNFLTYESRVHGKIEEVFSDISAPDSIEANLVKMIKKLKAKAR